MKNSSYFFVIVYCIIVAPSYAMEKQLDKSNTIKEIVFFDDILLKIFSSAQPRVKNYWRLTNKKWQQMGSKSVPRVYELYENYSPVCASTEDNKFVLFNAIWDGKTKVVENILYNNSLNTVIYKFPYFSEGDSGIAYSNYFDPYNIIESKKCFIESDTEANKRITINNLSEISELLKKYNMNKDVVVKSDFIIPHPLSIACYKGDENMLKELMKKYLINDDENYESIARCLFIPIERGHSHIVSLFCNIIEKNEKFKKGFCSIWFFNMAASLNRKDIFELLISLYKIDLNKLYHQRELTSHYIAENLRDQDYYTYLDLLHRFSYCYKHDMKDYINIVKKYGGKTEFFVRFAKESS